MVIDTEMGSSEMRVGFLLLITLKRRANSCGHRGLWPWKRGDLGASFEELKGWQVQKGGTCTRWFEGGNPRGVSGMSREVSVQAVVFLPTFSFIHLSGRSGDRHSRVPGTVPRTGDKQAFDEISDLEAVVILREKQMNRSVGGTDAVLSLGRPEANTIWEFSLRNNDAKLWI